MSWQQIGKHWGPALALAGSMACGSEPLEEPATGSAWTGNASSEEGAPDENRPPVIEALRIEPREPVAGDRLRAVASVNEPDGDSVQMGYVWWIDDRALAESGAEIELGDVARGTRIEVQATASDRHEESEPAHAEVVVRNRRPVLTGLELDPAGEVPIGHPVAATPEARDPDGDALRFRYQWSVNGSPVEEDGPRLDTAELRKGDELQVRVWVSDDSSESDPIYSHAVRIANPRPKIVSLPGGLDAEGVFRYAIEARDPDGDRSLRFQLSEGPPGMTVDPVTGEVLWRPTPEHAGVHAVELVVKDSEGASASQTFELTVTSETDPAPAAIP